MGKKDSISVHVESDDEGMGTSPFDWRDTGLWTDHGPDALVLRASDGTFRAENDNVILVEPQVSINSVKDINSVEQSFTVRYTLFLGLTITKSEFDRFQKDPRGFKVDEVPMFQPYNASQVDRAEPMLNPDGSMYFLYIKDGAWMAGHFQEHVVTYNSPLSLHSFPYDVQTLEMKFEIRDFQQSWSRSRPYFKINADAYWGGNSAGFQNVWVPPRGEWLMKPEWIHSETYKPNKNSWGVVYHVQLKVKRQWRYFLWRVMMVMSLITFCTNFVWALDEKGDILGYMSGLLVAAVAFLFTVSQFIPAVGYLTLLDVYVLANFFFILLSGCLSILLTIYDDRYGVNNVQDVRAIAGASGTALWFLGTIVYALRSNIAMHLENRKLKQFGAPKCE